MKQASPHTTCIDRVFFLAALILTLLGAVGWLASTEPYSDDWAYSCEVPVKADYDMWDIREAPIEDFGQVWQSIANHWIYENTRIGNIVLIMLQPLPRTVSTVLCGVLIALMLWMIYATARMDTRRRPLLWTAAGVMLLWCALPWYNHFQSLAYQLNYVPPSIFACLVVMMARGRGSIAAAIVVSLIAGLCHEGFACVLLAFLAVMFICERSLRQRLVAMAVGLVVALVLALMGGTGVRMAASAGMEHTPLKYLINTYIITLWPLWLAIFLTVLTVFVYRRRGIDAGPFRRRMAPLYAAALCGVAMTAVLAGSARFFWPAYLFGILIILDNIYLMCCLSRPFLSPRVRIVAACAACVVYAAWLLFLGVDQYRSGRQQRLAAETAVKALSGDDDVLFVDVLRPEQSNPLLMDMTSFSAIFEYHTNYMFAARYGGRGRRFLVLPAEYAGKTFDEFPSASADGNVRGIWPLFAVRKMPVGASPERVGVDVEVGPVKSPRNALEILLSRLSGLGDNDSRTLRISVRAMPACYRGDSITLLFMGAMPRAAVGREIKNISFR